MVLLFGGIYGSKIVIIEEDAVVERGVDVGVRETITRESGRSEGVDRLAVRGAFRIVVGSMSLSKLGMSRGLIS